MIRTVLVRSLAFILVLVALGLLGALAANMGSLASASTKAPPTTVPETTVFSTAQTTTVVQTSTVTITVTITPKPGFLLTPKDDAAIRLSAKRRLRFTWLNADQATYYSFQVYRGTQKILSAFPIRPAYALARRWTYLSKRYALKAGTYEWYVWPGFGMRSASTYGPLLGSRTFRVVP
jgi:hypothetical protein